MSEPYWVPLGAAPATPAPAGITQLFDVTLGAAAASISIPSIPQTYAHLKLMGLLRGDAAALHNDLRIQFSGDTGANYDAQNSQAFSTSVSAAANLTQTAMVFGNAVVAGTATAGRFTALDLTIPHYTSVIGTKTLIGTLLRSQTVADMVLYGIAGTWRTANAPVTSLLASLSAGNFVAGSRLTLYGLI